MEAIPKSGFFYGNKFARITLQAYEGVIGKNGLHAILNQAGQSSLIDNYPPDNLECEFDFADYTAIHLAMEEIYGPRASHGLALRAGRATFNDGLRNFGALAGAGDPAFKELPVLTKIRIGLTVSAKIFSVMSDQQSSVDEKQDAFLWTNQRCPICWKRKNADKPVCHIETGLLQALVSWFSGGLDFQINEAKCCAVGDTICQFVIKKEPTI
jgi:hypothetical protein